LSNIQNNNTFKDCGGVLISELIGGSHLYGLMNENSDIDYRGIFVSTNKLYTSGFEKVDSIVQNNEIDSTHYELFRFLQLLRKSNTQVMEILFAPDSAFTYKDDCFDLMRENRYNLIDSEMFKSSLKGYVFSEMRLATGERSGQLGGKRKEAVTTYGFSPKNFTQIIRLCNVGKIFYETGAYMVKVKDFDSTLHDFLMRIKNSPEQFTCEWLKEYVENEFQILCDAMDKSEINFKFDIDLACDIINKTRKKYARD
jgi:hypothetical protein